MKRFIIAFLSLAVMASSCSDYLDKEPENKRPIGDVDFSNTSEMFQPVAGIYAAARTEKGFSRWAMLGLLTVRGDDTYKGGTTTDQATFTLCKEFKYAQIRDFWALNESWNGLYNLVQNSNEAITNLEKYREYLTSDADLKLNSQYQAEVRFIRAYAFTFISRLWGDVPLLLNNSDVYNNIPKNTRAEVYAFINSELDFCSENLPAIRPNQMPYKGQVTKYTALALKAKINADINEWDAVLDASNQVIDSGLFSLYSDYYQYFKKPGRLADETLFELQYSDFGTSTGEMYTSDAWFEFQGPGNISGKEPMSGGWGFLVPSDEIVNLFKQRGESARNETTFLFSNSTTKEGDVIGNNLWGRYNGKAYLPSTQLTPGRTGYGVGNNIRMLRYADVLLLNAEAKVRKGQNGDAPFNIVRTRAQMPELNNVNLDQILEERRVELACEWGDRFFDLVRTGKAKDVLPGFKENESEFYPIPQAQINLNPNLQ